MKVGENPEEKDDLREFSGVVIGENSQSKEQKEKHYVSKCCKAEMELMGCDVRSTRLWLKCKKCGENCSY